MDDHALTLTRHLPAPPEVVWRAWTDPEALKAWFVPAPWRVTRAVIEPWPGGRFLTVMQGPDGEAEDCDNAGAEGCVLLAEAPHRLVWTDALAGGFRPNATPFMTADIRLDPEDGGTRYSARVTHATAEDRARHEAMGFAAGWGAVADQLAAFVAQRASAAT